MPVKCESHEFPCKELWLILLGAVHGVCSVGRALHSAREQGPSAFCRSLGSSDVTGTARNTLPRLLSTGIFTCGLAGVESEACEDKSLLKVQVLVCGGTWRPGLMWGW